jgi:hypothetical protein
MKHRTKPLDPSIVVPANPLKAIKFNTKSPPRTFRTKRHVKAAYKRSKMDLADALLELTRDHRLDITEARKYLGY